MDELISIIVPIYNGELEIERMVANLKQQEYPNLEFIIVDDGSNDETLRRGIDCTKDDNRFHIYHQENKGVSSARNTGLKNAHGKYIAFMDADDYIYPNYITYMHEKIKLYDADIFCGNYYKVQKCGEAPKKKRNIIEMTYEKEDAIEALLYRKNISSSACAKLYKKEITEKIAFPEGIIYSEDFFFVMRAFNKSARIAYNSKIIYEYVQNNRSAVHNMKLDGMIKSWRLFQSDILENTELMSLYNKAVYSKGLRIVGEFGAKLPDSKEAKFFEDEIVEYIKLVKKVVLLDKKNSYVNRVFAFSCFFSSNFALEILEKIYRYKVI